MNFFSCFCYMFYTVIIRLDDKSHWVSLFFIFFHCFVLCCQPSQSVYLPIAFSFIFIPFCFSYSQPFSLSCSVYSSLLLLCLSLSLSLIISIHMPSFYSFSFFSYHIFISMATLTSIVVLVFFCLHMSANYTCSLFAWLAYSHCHSYGRSSILFN